MTRNQSRTSDDPALDSRVRSLLALAAAPVEAAGPLPGEDEALAAFRTSAQCTRRTSTLSRLVSAKAAVASAVGTGVLLTGGVGAAAAGILPSAAQETVSTWLETVGISVPAGEGADDKGDRGGRSEQTPGVRADENGDRGGRSEQTPGVRADENGDRRGSEQTPGERAEPPPEADHGKRVSDTAKNSTAEGADKGREVAEEASKGRVKSGDRGPAETPQGGKPPGGDDRQPPGPGRH